MEPPGRWGLRALDEECMQRNTLAALGRGVMLSQDWESRPQFLFTVTDGDPNSPERKGVRVVTTVEYFLGD